jgi:hypothetical protein
MERTGIEPVTFGCGVEDGTMKPDQTERIKRQTAAATTALAELKKATTDAKDSLRNRSD